MCVCVYICIREYVYIYIHVYLNQRIIIIWVCRLHRHTHNRLRLKREKMQRAANGTASKFSKVSCTAHLQPKMLPIVESAVYSAEILKSQLATEFTI